MVESDASATSDSVPGPDTRHLHDATLSQLFALYRAILRELRGRGVVRTENAPAGDYAEYLVAAALGGELAPNSEKSWDVCTHDGRRLQVKARVVSNPIKAGQRQLSPFRSFDFDEAVIVLLGDGDYEVVCAVRLPRAAIESAATYRENVNGHIVFARPALLEHPDAVDVTALLRAVAARPGSPIE